MLPILPVLLLLLLNAPSKMDRVVGLKAIGVLESLHRKLEGGNRLVVVEDELEAERVWASLVSLQLGPGDLERAFATLLGLQALASEPALPEAEATRDDTDPPPSWGDPPSAIKEGFFACRRTRDGPVSR